MRGQASNDGFAFRVWATIAVAVVVSSVVPAMLGAMVVVAAAAATGAGTVSVGAGRLMAVALGRLSDVVTASRRDAGQRDAGGLPMRIGKMEVALVAFAAVFIILDAAAVLAGIGPYFVLVTLAYLMVAATVYAIVKRGEAPAPAGQAAAPLATRARQPAAVPAPEEFRVARRSDLLATLGEAEASAVLALGHWECIEAGTPLAEAGTPGKAVYVMTAGQVELTGRSDIGEVTVRVCGPGEAFPLAALLGDGTLLTSAVAMDDVHAFVVGRDALLAWCAREPAAGMRLFAAVAELLAWRYRSTLALRLRGVEAAIRQPELWPNI